MPLHTRILLGLGIGALGGLVANSLMGSDHAGLNWAVRQVAEPVGALFLRLLLMVVVPLVFSSLVVGVAGIGDLRRLGRVGLRCFVYTLVISGISVAIGLGLANTLRPGERLSPQTAEALQARYGGDAGKRVEDALKKPASQDAPLLQAIKTFVPPNPLAAVSSETPNMLHLMFFALALGLAATLLPSETVAPFLGALLGLYNCRPSSSN